MFAGVRLEDAVKSIGGLGLFIAGILLFGPRVAQRYGLSNPMEVVPAEARTAEHEVALQIEAHHERLDVLNIRSIEGTLLVTLLDTETGVWSEEELFKLTEVTFYPADLAKDSGLSVTTHMWSSKDATTVGGDAVSVYLHLETLTCPLSVIEDYDGDNATRLILRCKTSRGLGLSIDTKDLSWAGRGK